MARNTWIYFLTIWITFTNCFEAFLGFLYFPLSKYFGKLLRLVSNSPKYKVDFQWQTWQTVCMFRTEPNNNDSCKANCETFCRLDNTKKIFTVWVKILFSEWNKINFSSIYWRSILDKCNTTSAYFRQNNCKAYFNYFSSTSL